MEERVVMVTTIDNPFDYFTDFVNWLVFDNEKHYNTCNYLHNVIELLGGIPEDATQVEEDLIIEAAVDSIVTQNPLGIYKKIIKGPKNIDNRVLTALPEV